jgi:prepilin-type N-terminal cleavage/methylation domain-containing protein
MEQCWMINPNQTSKNKKTSPNSSPAFTIVELLVVIVVIAILATITIVSYTGITKQAAASSVQSNLKQLATTIDLDHATNSFYPATDAAINGGKGLPVTSDIAYTYNLISSTSYCASATSTTQSGITYHYTPKDGQIKSGDCHVAAITCPTGYIVVPGSSTYGTSDFCVMKYEAKNDGSNNAVSTAAGLPWVNISQTSAITTASAACSGCHLITEAEWMTIAQNVLGVASNWFDGVGTVGSGHISRGNSDGSAAMDGATDLTGINKRTLTLSNGEVIWDLAGNVFEWTSGRTNGTTAQQPGVAGNAYNSWIDWPNVTITGALSTNIFPSGTGIAGASSWTSASNGIGQLASNPADTSLHGFVRGGSWGYNSCAGVLAIDLSNNPTSYTDNIVGFRVSQ